MPLCDRPNMTESESECVAAHGRAVRDLLDTGRRPAGEKHDPLGMGFRIQPLVLRFPPTNEGKGTAGATGAPVG